MCKEYTQTGLRAGGESLRPQPFCWRSRKALEVIRAIGVLTCVAFVAVCGCAYTPLSEGIRASQVVENRHELVSGRYTLEPPDVIRVVIRGEPDLTTETPIQPDGYATVPMGGQLYLAGLTVEEAAEKIAEHLSGALVRPQVSVQVLQFNSRRVYVVGEVNAAAVVPYYGNLPVLQALTTAGGPSPRAAPNRTRLVRPMPDGVQRFKIHYGRIVKGKSDESNLLMRQGDILYVPPNRMVAAGYAIENFMFPIRSFFSAIFSGLNFWAVQNR